MRQKKPALHVNSHKIAFYFVLGIVALLCVSVLLRLTILVSKSKFDGTHRFTVLLSQSAAAKKQTVISLEPNTRVLSVVNLIDGPGVFPVSRFLEIPIDGKIQLTDSEDLRAFDSLVAMEGDMGGKDVSLVLGKLILDYNRLQTDVTIVDLVRFIWLSKGVGKTGIKYVAIAPTITEGAIDRLSASFFPDTEIQKENVTVSIVNATGVTGLGNRLARFITNTGGTVVSVSTSDKEEEVSKIIKRTKNTYTFQRLRDVLKLEEGIMTIPTPSIGASLLEEVPQEEKNTSDSFVSDIIIMIGKKSLSGLVF